MKGTLADVADTKSVEVFKNLNVVNAPFCKDKAAFVTEDMHSHGDSNEDTTRVAYERFKLEVVEATVVRADSIITSPCSTKGVTVQIYPQPFKIALVDKTVPLLFVTCNSP